MSAFHGITGLVELPSIVNWDPRAGDTLQRRYRGTRAECEFGAVSLRALKTRYSIEQPEVGGYAVLNVFASVDDDADPSVPLSSEWELVGEDLEKSIWVHPKWIAIAAKLRVGKDGESWWVAYFRSQIETLARGEATFTDREGVEFDLSRASIISDVDAIAGLTTAEERNLGQLIDDLCDGVESWPISRYVLRNSKIVAANTTIKLSYTGVGKMYTTAKLSRTEDIDQVILGTLPTGYWLKRTPTLRVSGSAKYQMTQEWWHADDYSKFLYDLA
jgi:hypothetical protein